MLFNKDNLDIGSVILVTDICIPYKQQVIDHLDCFSIDTYSLYVYMPYDCEACSVEFAVSTNSIEVFEVPEQALNCIYGERGSNLSRMKQVKLCHFPFTSAQLIRY